MKPEQITAWALDEASTEERQQLDATLLENPQDKQKADETKAFCDFLLSELRDESLALTDKQRERLVEQSSRLPTASGTLAQPPAASGNSAKTTRWNIGVIVRFSLAACAVLGGFWTWQVYSSRHSEARAVAAVAEKPAIKMQLAPKPEPKKKAGQGPEARLLAATPVKPMTVTELPAAKQLPPGSQADAAAMALKPSNPVDSERFRQVQQESLVQYMMVTAQAKKLQKLAQDPNTPADLRAKYTAELDEISKTARALMPEMQGTSESVPPLLSAMTLKKNQLAMPPGDVERLKRVQDESAYGLSFDGRPTVASAVVAAKPLEGLTLPTTGGLVEAGTGMQTLNDPNMLVGSGALLLNGATVTPKSGTLATTALAGISEIRSTVVTPAKPSGIKITSDTTPATRAEPTLVFGNTSAQPGYIATSGGTVAGTTVATTNSGAFGTNSLTVGNVVSATPMSRTDAVALTVGGASNFKSDLVLNGGVTINNGTVNPAPAAPAQGGTNTFVGTLTATPRDNVTVGAMVSGSGPIAKSGAGTLVLSGANTYSGTTTVNGGTLNVSKGRLLPSVDEFVPTGEVIAGAKMQMKRSAGATLDLSGVATTMPAAKPMVPGNPVAFAPVTDELGPTASVGYDSNYVWRGNNQGASKNTNVFEQPSLDASIAPPDYVSPSVSLNYSSIHNMGSLANGGGSNQFPGSSGAFGMNDIQQLTLGTNTNLGPMSNLDLNEAAKVAAAATSNPAAAAVVGTGGVTLINGGGYAAFGSLTSVGANTQAAAPMAGANTISTAAAPQPGAAGKVQSSLQLAGSSTEIGNYDAAMGQYQDVLRRDPYNVAARRGMEAAEQKRQEYFKAAYDNQRAKMLADVSETYEMKVPLLVQSGQVVVGKDAKTDDFYLGKNVMPEERKPEPQSQPSSGETYTRIIENELRDVAREPLSTLSIDVDTASYANVRRFLNQNMIPPPDAVRIEELVNYFPTSEEGPAHDAKEPFGVRVELAPCPWQPVHRLARIAIKGRELDKDRKASNLVFLVDVSGSMNQPNKLPLVQQSLRMLTEQLGEGDRVTMVVYAGSSGVVLPPTSGEKKEEILAAIGRLSAGGSTHGSAGIKLAYEQAVAGFIKGGVNRVILCTDGDFNVGTSSPEELEKLIKHKAKTGVFLSVLGFGSGNLQDRTMETLADKGNGNYAYIDSLSEARKVLVEQMSGTLVTIAKDVKIQVEFNPAAVRSYRLIGYENRLLAKEDFNDDTKDAGEIGAGHSVVALYEIVPANLPPGAEPRPLVDSLKYQAPAISPAQLAAAAKTGEMMTVKLRYKEPESDLSKLIEMPTKDEGKTLTASSDEFKFSAAVAGFGLLLRDSSYKGTLSWETVRRLALDGKGTDKQGYRGEFLQLIDKARGLKETR
jgi:autotransporter-associated beta strand protein